MNPKPTLCLYHNDLDGRASAAIVRRKLGTDTELLGLSYGDDTPWEKINTAERVIIVDFSLAEDEMLRVQQEKELIWIDHHQSALDKLGHHSFDWDGNRDTSQAACVLTWRYFYPQKAVPRAIVLIGDRDIWRWEEDNTGPFNEGLRQRDTHPENDSLWTPLLEDKRDILQSIIAEGEILLQARLNKIQGQIHSYGYSVIFEGHRTLAINQRGSGELGAAIRELGYEIAYCYMDNFIEGELRTFVSLYADEVDVSKIAQKFGGGGHPGASGFYFSRRETPFPSQASVQFIADA